MCNINGYIGSGNAAPVLIEMMRRQSGYGGGFYTGLATIHEGRLYYAKVLGDVDRLVAETDAMQLPGHIGILHSRSNSGGDWHWSHPFISNDSKLAYVANGASGMYNELRDADALTRMLEDKGVVFDSASPGRTGGYPLLRNGCGVHISEAMCHLERDIMLSEGLGMSAALEQAFLRFPSEIVALSVCTDEPDRIAFARFNQPMMVGRSDGEVFLGTSAISFPSDRSYMGIEQLPESSAGYVSLAETAVHRFRPQIPVTPLRPRVMHDVYDCVVDALRAADAPMSVGALCGAAKDCWPVGEMPQKAPAVYEVLRQLNDDGRLETVKTTEPGAPEGRDMGITTTAFRVRLKEA